MFATDTVQIVDAQPDCECQCCGRKLKLGAVVSGGVVIGVDCLAAVTLASRYVNPRMGRVWKAVPGSQHRDTLKRIAGLRKSGKSAAPGETLKVRQQKAPQ